MKRIYICSLGFTLLFNACAENSDGTSADILGLHWYAEEDTVKQAMQNYTLKNESEEIGASGDIQKLLEYSGASLYEQPCDVVLCFTNLGLIGINYHDTIGQYEQWIEQITNVYGEPTELSDFGIASWENDPLGAGTDIYIFEMEYDVQISFFVDETGSETATQ